MKQRSLFIVSLDFELFWGVRDKRTLQSYGANILGVRRVIPALLKIFEQYGISATFATVGFLFARDREELTEHIPSLKPDYLNSRYSPYNNNYLNSIGFSEKDDLYHYGESLIQLIQQNGNHEIASHTFSHFYCLENASFASFRADMSAAKNIALRYGIELKTIVFPRNQYADEHLQICKDLGFIAYRGNEQSSAYRPRKNDEQSKLIRATRFADSYLNLTGHHTFNIYDRDVALVNIPASRFLRPYSPALKRLDPIRLKRIKKSMTYAAENNQCYHLWWHPHNFGINLTENLSFLEEILKHYKKLHEQFGMESKNMKIIAQEILEPHAL